jgi:hypothetical protein
MTEGRPSARRSLALAALASALVAIVVAGGGCEVAIGDTVPAFNCVSGPDVCPAGSICYDHKCIRSCVEVGCPDRSACNPFSGLCASMVVDGGMGDDVGVNDGPGQDADVVDSMTEEDANPPIDTGGGDTTNHCPGTANPVLCGCSGPSQCASGVCSDSLAVGMPLYNAAGKSNFCTQPCCTSKDCPSGAACYATGQGGNYCVDPAWIGRSAPVGGTLGGGNCSRNADCRSGLCSGTYCVDTCCSTPSGATDCAGGDSCQIGTFPGANAVDQQFAAYCAYAPTANGQDGASCGGNGSCQSNLCAQFNPEPSPHCRDACRNDADCTSNDTCVYVIPSQTGTPVPLVAACAPPQGTVAMGTTCDMTTNCKGFCDTNATMKCTAPCFADSDCSAVANWRCRPVSLSLSGGGSYEVLACGP